MKSETSKNTAWSIFDVKGVDLDIGVYPETPYISPTPGKLPLVAVRPVPASLMDAVQQAPETYGTTLFSVMNSVSKAGCNAIAMSGTFEQLKDQFKEVDNLAKGFYPLDPPTQTVTKDTERASAEDNRAGNLPEIKPPVLPPYGGPELAVLLNTPLLHEGVVDCVHVIDLYRNNPYVKGYFIMNEPRHWDWGNVVLPDSSYHDYNKLTLGYKTAMMYGKYHEADPLAGEIEGLNYSDQLIMFNVAASMDSRFIGQCKDYEEYLLVLDRLFNPSMRSFSFNPFSGIGNTSDNSIGIMTDHNHFYEYLDIFSKYTRDAQDSRRNEIKGRPFWATCYVQSCTMIHNKGTVQLLEIYPSPNAGMLRFEAFSSLAYGAKGLLFSNFGLEADRTEDGVRMKYGVAPLSWGIPPGSSSTSPSLIKSSLCDVMKTVIEEIKTCQRAFLDTTFDKAAHFGETYGRPVTSLPFGCLTSLQYEGNGILATVLNGMGRNYLVMVSHNALHAQRITFTLRSDRQYGWSYFTPSLYSEVDEQVNTASMEQSLTLPPGGVAIFEWIE